MNRRLTILIFFLLALQGYCAVELTGQESSLKLPAVSGEQLHIITDRSLYGVSEKILFSLLYRAPAPSGTPWSSVIYVELISWDGTKIGQSKAPVQDGFAAGSVQIPFNISSGNYYLRAYTRWMRNYSAYSYAYLPVKIVNPLSGAIVAGPEAGGSVAAEIADIQKELNGVVVSGLQEAYERRELINMKIELDRDALPGTYSVGVVRAGYNEANHQSFNFESQFEQDGERVVEHLPELNGLSLTGHLVDDITGEPVGDRRVNLSSVSGPFYFSSDMTDKEGAFLFTLPYKEGQHEMHISPEGEPDREYRLLITGEFCSKPVQLPYVPFFLKDHEKEMARELLLNIQINERFDEAMQPSRHEQTFSKPFYGRAASVTFTKDYIELINLEEFFYELIRSVTVSNRGRDPYLVVNSQGSLGMFPPLVLMDNMRVKNDNSLLETPARRVERIEVVNSGYILGKEKYSGIISVFSKENDLAGLKPENSSRYFNYHFFNSQKTGLTHGEEGFEMLSVPDRRLTLFWEPGLRFSAGYNTQVEFYSSDVPGDYEILIRGLDRLNNIVEYRSTAFTVSK